MHPLAPFRYCPRCGSEAFAVHNAKAKACEACGLVYYANAYAATAALILNERNELLVTRRAYEPARGTLDLPGGFVDMEESAEAGVVREVSEETGLTVTASRYLFSLPNIYPYSGVDVHTLDLFFCCRVDGTEAPEANDDVEESFFVPVDRLDPADFGLRSIRCGIERFIQMYRDEVFREESISRSSG